MCEKNKYSSFLCVLGLSSVLDRPLSVIYPDCGLLNLKRLFGTKILLYKFANEPAVDPMFILFFKDDGIYSMNNVNYKANHFVPIMFLEKKSCKALKRQASVQTRLPYFMVNKSKVKKILV